MNCNPEAISLLNNKLSYIKEKKSLYAKKITINKIKQRIIRKNTQILNIMYKLL